MMKPVAIMGSVRIISVITQNVTQKDPTVTRVITMKRVSAMCVVVPIVVVQRDNRLDVLIAITMVIAICAVPIICFRYPNATIKN